MLSRRLGAERVAAEPQWVDELITLCARLPIALVIVAARAAAKPSCPLEVLARELRDTQGCLDAFTAGEDLAADLRSVFSWSYRTLGADAARLFRLLGLHPGRDIAIDTAASIASTSVSRVRRLLAELVRANLLVEHVPSRFTFHDLLRAYATERAHATDANTDRHAAVRRMLDHYLHTAYAAALLLDPHRKPITLAERQPGTTPTDLADHDQAMIWFTNNRIGLLAVAELAASTRFHTSSEFPGAIRSTPK